ncbi:MAG: hypothetical protein AB7S41_09025 [Parvibaculaceae bacterium]
MSIRKVDGGYVYDWRDDAAAEAYDETGLRSWPMKKRPPTSGTRILRH